MITTLLFYLFATVLVASSIAIISVRNPVYAVLSLILAFFNAAGLFVLLGAEFLAMVLVIVYVGAVAILFLFIVMMLDINTVSIREGFLKYLPFGAFVAVLLFVELFLILSHSHFHTQPVYSSILEARIPENITNTEALGHILYTKYFYAFQVSGIVLLVAMVSAIVLSLRNREGVKRQDIAKQVYRTREESIEVIEVETGKGV